MNSEVHRIRIRGHWQHLEEAGDKRYARHFGQPRPHQAGERFFLTGIIARHAATLYLNDKPLTTTQPNLPFSVEVTSQLQPRNRLLLEFQTPTAEPPDELTLEIRPPELPESHE